MCFLLKILDSEAPPPEDLLAGTREGEPSQIQWCRPDGQMWQTEAGVDSLTIPLATVRSHCMCLYKNYAGDESV